MRLTLEEYLRHESAQGHIDHMIRAHVFEGRVTFYVHPYGHDGQTQDYEVAGNTLGPNRDVQYPGESG